MNFFFAEKSKLIDLGHNLNGGAGCIETLRFISENRVAAKTLNGLEVYELSDYQESDKILKSVLISKINTKVNYFFIRG